MLGSAEFFTTVDPGLDDADLPMGNRGRIPLKQWVASLAFLKAKAGAEVLRKRGGRAGGTMDAGVCDGECIVIGADTLVDQDGEVLSKPRDAADAERMIKLVRNRSHEVLTGVALLHPASGHRDVYADRAVVTVGPIDDAAVASYVAGGNWRGKSGAYNLGEQLKAGWPLKAEGDPGCVVGLPTVSLKAHLKAFVASLPSKVGGAA